MSHNKHVIVTDVEYRMSVAAIRDLYALGYKIVTVTTKDRSASIGSTSRYVEDCNVYYISNMQNSERSVADTAGPLTRAEYAVQLDNICAKYIVDGTPPVVFPIGKLTLYALSEHGLRNAKYLVSDLDTLNKANNKSAVLSLAESLGIPIPKQYTLRKEETIESFSHRIAYPCVIKYQDGEALGLKADKRYAIIHDSTDFVNQYIRMSHAQSDPLVQQYIKGDGYGFCCVVKDGIVRDAICHKRLREYPISGGPSTCCISVDPKSSGIDTYSKKLLNALCFQGIAMVEFKGNDADGYYLMEINPRIWGSFPLTRATKSRFSDSYCKSAVGDVSQILNSYNVNIKMSYWINDLAACMSYIKNRQFGKGLAGLLDIINPFVKDGLMELNDVKPFWAYVKNLRR